ncbi:cytochrome P450 9e2-like isoform X2 [Leptinotarsa decemlineata]
MLPLIIGVALLVTLFYYMCVKPMYYWQEKGVKQTDPVWIFGDNLGTTFGTERFIDMVDRCYNKFSGNRYHGIYEMSQPTLLIKDPELLKKITVKDFDHFMDHKPIVPEEVDQLWNKNLFSLRGKKWREMRPILSPSFTSSKMRTMFILMSKCAEDFVNHFLKKNQDCFELEMRDTFTRFTNDVIATAAFGVKVDSLEAPNNEFYLMGKEATNFGGIVNMIKFFGLVFCPKIMQFFGISFISRSVNNFFRKLVDDTIKAREENNIIRPDMIHLLMEAKKGIHHNEETVEVDTGFATVEEANMGKKWREMRPILSPSFTSSKMRTMFILMSKCAEDFVNHFLKKNQDCFELEMRDTFTRFTNDVIATAAFGVKVDSLEAPNNEFYLMGKEATNFGGIVNMIKFFGLVFCPKIMQFFGISFISRSVNNFFRKLVDDTIKAREENNIIRPDMIHLLMEAKKGIHHNEETVEVDTGFATVEEANMGKGHITELTNTDITAQALIFFFAGFDSVSSLMCFMAHELAVNSDIQIRLRKEINETSVSCGGSITYEALLKMKYMDMVVSETLRKWPSALVTDRICTKPYTIVPVTADENPVHIEKKTLIMIPIFGIHRDPKYYPDPLRFDPERFSDENKGNINTFAYMPFGLGPRNCIGSRFGLLETKLIFFHLLFHFELVPVKKTSIPMKLAKGTFNLMAEGGFWLGLKRMKK